MELDNYLLRLNNIKVKLIKVNEDNRSYLNALENVQIGYFEYYPKELTMCISDYMSKIYPIDYSYEVTMFDLINSVLVKNEQFRLYDTIKEIFDGGSSLECTLPFEFVDRTSWYKFSIKKDDANKYVGTMHNVDKIISLESNIENESLKLNQVFNSIPIPLYYYDYVGNILFTNRHYDEDMSVLNKIVEQYINGEKDIIEKYNWITYFDVILYQDNLMKFEIHYERKSIKKIHVIHRVNMHSSELEPGILFLHEDASDIHVDDRQLTKILKANELIIEIKDLIDHVNDLNSMYDYLLSRIHTVIPSAKRACILMLDKNSDMYITASYGYVDDYVGSVKLPFEKSFANSTLRGDYTKSVILNDIQEKFASIYPDINDNQYGFQFESNMVAPLVINGMLYGLLSLDSDKNNVFDDVDLNLFDYLKLQIERAIIKFKKLSRVKKDSIIDPLTGIFNRRHLLDLFEQFCEDATQMNKSFALVLFDLDKLKAVNDSHGHLAGDKIIKQFAFVSSSEIREIDVIARIGGDEFVGLFWDIDKHVLTERICRWQEILKTHKIKYEEIEIETQFSFGISMYNVDGNSYEDMMRVADKKMYIQKNGKNE